MGTGGAIVINLCPEGCRHKAKPDGPTPFFFPSPYRFRMRWRSEPHLH